MDYEKTNERVDRTLSILEEKIIDIFRGNLNFIRNLRKYITNEANEFESILTGLAIKLTAVIIFIELIFKYFGYQSILGLTPKVITLILFLVYSNKEKFRRKS